MRCVRPRGASDEAPCRCARRAHVRGSGVRLHQGLHGVLYTTWRFRLHTRRRTARNNLAPNPALRMPLPAASSRHRRRQARVAAAHFKRAIWREEFHVCSSVPILDGPGHGGEAQGGRARGGDRGNGALLQGHGALFAQYSICARRAALW
jgi:hypothetical protein